MIKFHDFVVLESQSATYVYSVLQCFNPTHNGGQEFNLSVTELKPQISAVQVEGKQLKESCSTQVNYVHYTSVLSIVILYIAVFCFIIDFWTIHSCNKHCIITSYCIDT